ncbi:DUF421 domain-containing protein [Gemmobacter lanyuensis]|uniref:DUF421 domain-containing protein n=2 Tax=Gemmobacter lanyuensis TaxID=1054497 RepID=A0A918J1A7_9RHOB|nr:YetF domain-containing protein [Gemmobacter lanyuensis]GGW42735.1 DUF421 domain-containing protein [Gemmobacter lanyuensis]
METVVPFDLQRMVLGDQPPLFLAEILFRIAVIWPWTMLLLRWIGGRSISQLSLVEFLLVIALGSAVGDSLFYPDVPLVHAMLVIFVIIAIDKLVDQAIRLFRPAKGIFDGQPVEVLRDGVIHMSARGTRQIGNLELMELLRLKGVENLGSVRCAYMETSGALSVFAADPPQPGLRIVPPVECVPADCSPDQARCCVNCGQMDDAASHCPNCGTDGWAPAIAAPKYR